MNYFSTLSLMKIKVRSRSTDKINEKLTKKQQKKLEMELLERNQNVDPTHSTGSSERDLDSQVNNFTENTQIPRLENYIDLNQLTYSNGKIIQNPPKRDPEAGKGENIPEQKESEQPKTQTDTQQQKQKSLSLPSDDQSQNSSMKPTKDFKFIVDSPDKQNEYIKDFGEEFSRDSFQLEALFYQLSKHDFQRMPITQSAPVLAYRLERIIYLFKSTVLLIQYFGIILIK